MKSTNDSCSVTLNTALLAHIEMLEAENAKLKLQCEERKYFQIEFVADLGTFLHWLLSYKIFDFLGPSFNQLHYWGLREGDHQRKHDRKLDPKNQFFMLVKLRLNIKLEDLSFRFGLSTSVISRYLTTRICFFISCFYGNGLDAISGTS